MLRTVGVIDPGSARMIDEIAKGLILVALAAVGLSTRLALLRALGPGPFFLGMAAGALLAALSLTGIIALGLAPTLP